MCISIENLLFHLSFPYFKLEISSNSTKMTKIRLLNHGSTDPQLGTLTIIPISWLWLTVGQRQAKVSFAIWDFLEFELENSLNSTY